MAPPREQAASTLSPWPVRLAVFAALILLALGAIVLIDRHAMATMHRINHEQTSPPPQPPEAPKSPQPPEYSKAQEYPEPPESPQAGEVQPQQFVNP